MEHLWCASSQARHFKCPRYRVTLTSPIVQMGNKSSERYVNACLSTSMMVIDIEVISELVPSS